MNIIYIIYYVINQRVRTKVKIQQNNDEYNIIYDE